MFRRSLSLIVATLAATLLLAGPAAAAPQPFVLLTQWGTSGTGNGQFDLPLDVAIHPNGNVFVADAENHRVQVFSPDGTFLTSFNRFGRALMGRPIALAIGGGFLYVEDYDNGTIGKFNMNSLTFAGSWPAPSHNGPFPQAGGKLDLAVDASGNLWSIKDGSHVVKFSPSGVVLAELAFPASADYITGIAFDPNGFLVSPDWPDHHLLRMVPSTGQTIMDINVSAATSGSILNGLTIDTAGTITVADTQLDRLYSLTSNGLLRQTIGQGGTGPLQFDFPQTAAANALGVLYVADANNDRVQKITESASLTVVVTDDLEDPGPTYTFTISNGPTPVPAFQLDHNADPTLPNTKATSGLVPGTYRVTESGLQAQVKTITCTNGVQTSDYVSTFVDITPHAGESVTCTFYNEWIG